MSILHSISVFCERDADIDGFSSLEHGWRDPKLEDNMRPQAFVAPQQGRLAFSPAETQP